MDKCDWSPKDISLVDTDFPLCVIELQYLNGENHVPVSATVRPAYLWPGFVEQIDDQDSCAPPEFDEL